MDQDDQLMDTLAEMTEQQLEIRYDDLAAKANGYWQIIGADPGDRVSDPGLYEKWETAVHELELIDCVRELKFG